MTRFLDVRTWPVGGPLALRVAVFQGTLIDDCTGYDEAQLNCDVSGQHVLLATHGFNVNREHGIASLSNWESLILNQLPAGWLYIGILWPGDSIWLHGLDYPGEPKVADDAGQLLGPYLDGLLASASSVNLASHSLGARVVLQIVRNMKRSPSHAVLMAGAINDDCLSKEFAPEANRVGRLSVMASAGDKTLRDLFPIGNFLGGILDEGHPWVRAALGRTGPRSVGDMPATISGPWQIPDCWEFDHPYYLQIHPPVTPVLSAGTDIPPQGSPIPALKPDGSMADGWQEAFSSAVAATVLQR
jgi:hypothetical protein